MKAWRSTNISLNAHLNMEDTILEVLFFKSVYIFPRGNTRSWRGYSLDHSRGVFAAAQKASITQTLLLKSVIESVTKIKIKTHATGRGT
jgi:hypothetical protein